MCKLQETQLSLIPLLLALLAPLSWPGCTSPALDSGTPSSTPYTIFLPEVVNAGAATAPVPIKGAGTEPSSSELVLPPLVSKPDYGVQLHVPPGGDLEQTLRWAQGLGVGWIKEQVQWHTIEHGPGDFDWQNLDRLVTGADGSGFRVLLGVTHAPDWTRTAQLESGPPTDYAEFGRFMEQLAQRYRGRVEAYELWNEPNLAREWRGDRLDPARFVALVAEGAAGVRAADPQALVISGAPAVTGIDDGETAMNDRVFLRGMVEGGIVQHVDAIGAHPYGYANPPEESVQDEHHAASSHNDHPTFFFRDTLEDYHQILLEHGLGEHQIWVTEFGWPSAEGMGEMELTGWEYGREVSEQEQADYIVRAFHMGDEQPWVGPMFLWNLNLAMIWGAENAFSAYSLLRPDGSYRPSYVALRLAQPLER